MLQIRLSKKVSAADEFLRGSVDLVLLRRGLLPYLINPLQ